jgi:hypothetical protein
MTILLVTIVTVSFSSYSFKSATNALTGQRAMKLRWGTLSCQRAILESRRELLEPRENSVASTELPPNTLARRVIPLELDQIEYLIVLSDESARADLNVLLNLVSQSQVEEFARQFLDPQTVRLELKPLRSDQHVLSPVFPPLQSWDQVLNALDEPFLSPEQILRETKEITLWGGKLNYQSANEDVLRETAKLAVGAIVAERLVTLRRNKPQLSWTEAQPQLSLTETQSNRLDQLLGNNSSAQSVGIISVDGNHVHYSLLIRKVFAGSAVRFYSFTW